MSGFASPAHKAHEALGGIQHAPLASMEQATEVATVSKSPQEKLRQTESGGIDSHNYEVVA